MAAQRKSKIDFSQIPPERLAYYAGFIDADGSIIALFVFKKDYVLKYQIRISCNITQLKKRVHKLKEIQAELGGMGVIREDRGDKKEGKKIIDPEKQIADYTITGPKDLKLFLEAILPYLRMKQRQAQLVLDIIEQLPLINRDKAKFLEVGILVEQNSKLNDSKESKRINTLEKITLFFKTLDI